MEFFFAPLQKNILGRSWVTHEELRITIVTWGEWIYRHGAKPPSDDWLQAA